MNLRDAEILLPRVAWIVFAAVGYARNGKAEAAQKATDLVVKYLERFPGAAMTSEPISGSKAESREPKASSSP